MSAQTQKPQNIGSAYVNVKKGSPQELVDEVAEAVEFLRSKKAYISISMRKSNGDGYVNMTGFFNDYKREGQRDPDIQIRLSTISYGESKPAGGGKFGKKGGFKKSFGGKPAAAPKAKADVDGEEFGGEEVPF